MIGVAELLLFKISIFCLVLQQANSAEKATTATFMSLSGIGVSLVNGLQEEVAFATMSSAPAIWEVEVKNKWKMLNMELASWLEEKWRNEVYRVYLDDFLEVGSSDLCTARSNQISLCPETTDHW